MSALPMPDAAACDASRELLAAIVTACRARGGSIGFDQYMEHVLYAPGCGYYSRAQTRIGAGGDFVTAPEISPRFAAALARPVAQALTQLANAWVLEVGAGRGTLARGVIAALAAAGIEYRGYCILERSASARAEQAATLGVAAKRVRWLERWPDDAMSAVVIGNELLDAIAAVRFVYRADGVQELRVAPRDGGLGYLEAPFEDRALARRIDDRLSELPAIPDGYVSEFAPAREAWLASLSERLESGMILLADYGYPRREYYHPQRVNGTLACHYRQHVHDDPFYYPGLQDLSVHVEFTALAECAVASGLDLAGYTTQAHFLLENGLLDGLDDPALAERERYAVAHAVRQLTLPAEMGEAVKFIAFTRAVDLPVAGFQSRDMIHRL